jgi:endonuclease/exonuclease/phosphatase family metal-dependent hydrolase
MTRNVYVGADITAPLRAVTGLDGPAAIDALGHTSRAVLGALEATDFGVRGRLLAGEIAASAPDLVGLQEVALWRRGSLDLARIGQPDVNEVLWDFLAVLLTELSALGTPYAVGAAFEGADVEAPAFTGSVLDDSAAGQNIRMTMSDVILVRAGSGISILGRHHQGYQHQLVVEVAGLLFAFAHGLAWVDVDREGERLRFATTHLDSERPDIALGQAQELVATAGATALPLVVVGDFNSDPDDDSRGPYDLMTAEGFTDAAAASSAADPTWGFGPGLTDDDSTGFSQRIDFVFTRGPGISVVSSARTGVCAPDRDPATGLWPSDHAGVVATLQ